jgi:purine nucleosidase
VFTSLRPGSLRLIAHDAVNFVPVTADYVGFLTANAQTPAAQYVATLMNQPLLIGAIRAGLPVFWWDPLAALAATDDDFVQYEWDRITVIQDGVSSGRTIESPAGAWMRVAVSADPTLFESTLLNVLNNADSHP